MGDAPLFVGCGICCLCIILPMVIMLAVSFQKIDANEVALRKNRHFHYKASDDVETNGLHYVGLWHTFVKITKTDKFGNYQITAFTSNVIQVQMLVTIQYQLEPTYQNLYNIMFNYDNMGAYFNARVQDAVRRGVQSLHSDYMYSNRALVTQKLRENVASAVIPCGYSLNNLQVTEISVPLEMQAAIDDLVDATLDIDVAFQERDKSLQNADNQKNRDVHAATITADLAKQTAYAEFNASKTVLDAELYKLQRDVNNTYDLIRAYMYQFQDLQPKQIMELIKNHRYNVLLSNMGATGSNKILLDHKPTAAANIGSKIEEKLSAVYVEGLVWDPYYTSTAPSTAPTNNPTLSPSINSTTG